jgi:hypothetical protein
MQTTRELVEALQAEVTDLHAQKQTTKVQCTAELATAREKISDLLQSEIVLREALSEDRSRLAATTVKKSEVEQRVVDLEGTVAELTALCEKPRPIVRAVVLKNPVAVNCRGQIITLPEGHVLTVTTDTSSDVTALVDGTTVTLHQDAVSDAQSVVNQLRADATQILGDLEAVQIDRDSLDAQYLDIKRTNDVLNNQYDGLVAKYVSPQLVATIC